MKRYVFALLGLGLMTGPALASEFYIIKHHDAKECVIVETKPEDVAIIIGDKVYDSHEEAFAELAVVCPVHDKQHDQPKAYDY